MIQRITAVAILLAFLLPTLPFGQADNLTSTDWTTAQVDNQGHSVPFAWENKLETTRFWLDADEDGHECQSFGKSSPCLLLRRTGNGNGENEEQHTLYDLLSTAPGALPNVPFIAPYGIIEADTTIYQLEANLVLQSGQPQQVLAQLTADGADLGAPAVVQMTGAVPQYPIVPVYGSSGLADHDAYQGIADFGEQGVTIQEGQELGVKISFNTALVNPGTGFRTELHYGDRDSAPSWIRITADSAKVNAWTEDKLGRVENVFPAGTGLSPEDRAFDFFVAHGNGLGDETLQQDNGGNNLFHHHVIKSIRGPDGANLYGTKFVAQNPNPVDILGGDDTPGFDLFRYRMFYAEDVEPGTYRITIEDRRDDWEYVTTIIIGGSGVDLRVLGDSTHAVNLDEPTEFTLEVENTGAVTADIALSLDSLAGSWGAQITPNLLSVSAGGIATAKLLVTPAFDNSIGDVKEFTVTAANAVDGISDSETVTVRIVEEVTSGVDVFSRIPTVTIGPGVTRETLIGVRNLGTFQEDFVLTQQNVPAGWRVQINPASVDLFSKSDDNVRLKITAPPNAVAGTSFIARITATSVNDLDVTDTLELPIGISIKDGLAIDVHSGEVADDNGKKVYIHRMRDEGTDSTCPITESVLFSVAEGFDGSCWDNSSAGDDDFDESTIYRIEVTNTGDRDDVVTFEAAWNMGVPGVVDHGECDNGRANTPDGWRFAFIEEDGESSRGGIAALTGRARDISANQQQEPAHIDLNALFDRNDPHSFTIPAGQTKYVYAQLAWRSPVDSGGGTASCPYSYQDPNIFTTMPGARRSDPSPVAAVDVLAFSQNDPTIRSDFRLQAQGVDGNSIISERRASNFYTTGIRGVHVDFDANQAANQDIVSPDLDEDTQAVFHMRAVNQANEFDVVRITIPSTVSGWDLDLDINTNVGIAAPGETETGSMYVTTAGNADGVVGTSRPTDRNPGCTGVFNEGTFRVAECMLGIYDEVAFDVIATPPSDGEIGDDVSFTVNVESKDSFQAVSGEPFILRDTSDIMTVNLVGSFLYDIRSPACPIQEVSACEVNVVPGGTVSLPYSIENKGTAGDDFIISLSKVPAPATGWDGRVSSIGTIFIPAGKTHHGFVSMRAPALAEVGDEELYRLKIESIGSADTRLVDITATVVAAPTALSFVGTPADYLVVPGTDVDVTLQATRLSGAAPSVFIDANQAALPDGWSVSLGDGATVNFDGDGLAVHTMTISVPEGEIGNSRVPLPISANDGTETANTEIVFSLNPDSYGFTLESKEDTHLIVPGSSIQIPIKVRSNVLGTDVIDLTHAALPTGWKVAFNQKNVPLQALQEVEVIATVEAPANIAPGTERLLVVTGTSRGDSAITDTLELTVKTTQSLFEINVGGGLDRYVAPEETQAIAFTVYNNGTARDNVKLTASLGPAYAGLVNVALSETEFELKPGTSKTVIASVTVPGGIVSGARIPLTVEASSAGSLQQSLAKVVPIVNVLHYRSMDVDGDLIEEFAIDRNRDIKAQGSDGYESFTDPNRAEGILTDALDMLTYMTEEAVASWRITVTDEGGNSTELLDFILDANLGLLRDAGDYTARWDFFLDTDADGLPDRFYNPDLGVIDELETSKDVTGDGIREYFVDATGDDVLDVWYDLTTGRFGNLIQLDSDGDGIPDTFVVDLDGDGEADESEPVLLTKNGVITSITEQVDVDGDGKLDSALDTDGDGKVDCFRPHGSATCIKINHRDVTGDGIADWTYDSNGDGRDDRFYNPATGETGSIDTEGEFLRSIGEYWYVSAVFGLVMVLFVVLLVVTRR